MPTNIYGPDDNFDEMNSHVIPALISKFFNAVHGDQEKVVLGYWKTRSRFSLLMIFAALLIVLSEPALKSFGVLIPQCSHVNIGSNKGTSIKEVVTELAKQFNFSGEVDFDVSKPDGMAVKVLANERIHKLG